MKTLIFLFTLILSVVIVSGYKQSAKNELTKKETKPVHMREVKSDKSLNYSKKTLADPPKILFILNKEPGQAKWSPSLWWSYKHTTPEGC
jgi:hypothetical protein